MQNGSASERAVWMLSALGGVWNLGNGFNPIGKAAIAFKLSPRVFAEGTVWVRSRPRVWCSEGVDLEGCRDRIYQKAATIGAFAQLVPEERGDVPFLGASIGIAERSTIANAHAGVRVGLPRFGLRFEAVGQLALDEGRGTAYELVAGGYIRF